MESRKLFLPLLFIVFLMAGQGLARRYSLRSSFQAAEKLYVFGDSYVDTGNQISGPFVSAYPNGITYPGEAAGRFSDGFVLTDYFAIFLGLKSPIPYKQLHKHVENAKSIDGVNFAFGGTGVFDTLFPGPNLNSQINFFQGLIDNSTLTPQDIDSSVTLISVSGNDYMTYLVTNIFNISGLIQGLKPFIRSMVNNVVDDLKRINSLGVKKVVVTALGPVECVPFLTFLMSYQQCFPILSLVADYHNTLLEEAITKLNNEAIDDSRFIILDLHRAFSYVIQNKGYPEGNITFPTPLKPCCSGICGMKDEGGKDMYELCEDPKSTFYWDFVHPTHMGWFAALSYMTNTLKQSA